MCIQEMPPSSESQSSVTITKVLDVNNQIVDSTAVNYANVYLYGTDGTLAHDDIDKETIDVVTDAEQRIVSKSLYYQDFPTGMLNTKGTFNLTTNVSFSVKFRIDYALDKIPDTAVLFSWSSSTRSMVFDIRNASV